ncbi:MAG: ChaN family lipoprotein [Myxococcales bacterium]|nr:ChaN family lipoprotein [Myxococcales bacterium]
MRDSLMLHLALYRRQKAQISRAVEGRSHAFRAYEERYRKATRCFERAITSSAVEAEVRRSDIVYVGDYHTLRQAQEGYLRLVRAALSDGRRVVLALEFIEGRHQKALEAFLAGRCGERTFLERTGHLPGGQGSQLWPNFRPVLELARRENLEVLAIDRRAGGPRSLELRDRYAASRIAAAAREWDRPRLMVLMGQFHVAPAHLPAAVRVELGPEGGRRHLVVYQSCEGVYFELLRRGLADRVEAVRIRDGELCLVGTSPVVCQQSFLDYLEAEAGDEPLGDGGAGGRFRELAELLGRFAGVDVRPMLLEVEVCTAQDATFLGRLGRRGGLSRGELAQVREQVLSRESCYLPRARTVYLGSLSLSHAAEEAAHFVRHCLVGDAMDRPRKGSDAFYAACLEEALGFLGSKLVNPRRRCRDIEQWSRELEVAKGEARQIAAFILALKAAEADGPKAAAELLPLRKGRLFHAVSHGLGYLLGEALYRAFDSGRLGRNRIRELFRDPFSDARARYFEFTARHRLRWSG